MTESKETPPHFACAESLYRAKQLLAQAGIDGTCSASCIHSLTQGTGRTELLSQHGKCENRVCGCRGHDPFPLKGSIW